MSGRGLKARATRPALPRAAAVVRRRGLKARATRPALPRAAADVRRRGLKPALQGKVEKLISTQRLQTTGQGNRERTPLAGGTA